MSTSARRLWPLDPRLAIVAAPVIFLVALVGVALLREISGWPPAQLDQMVYLTIVGFSILPVVLMVVDLIAERGGRIGFRGLTLEFSQSAPAPATFAVPQNIGVPGKPLADSDTVEILDGLKSATSNEVVIIDLADGSAWWETRLLVLLAGAVRLGRPRAVVFTALDGGVAGRFHGWAPPSALFPLLLRADKRYGEIYAPLLAFFRQWELLPPDARAKAQAGDLPPPLWIGGAGPQKAFLLWAHDTPPELGFERLLQGELGSNVEVPDHGGRSVSVTRLEELFRPVLRTHSIDEALTVERQIDAVLSADDGYLAITRSGTYLRMITQTSALAAVVRSGLLPAR